MITVGILTTSYVVQEGLKQTIGNNTDIHLQWCSQEFNPTLQPVDVMLVYPVNLAPKENTKKIVFPKYHDHDVLTQRHIYESMSLDASPQLIVSTIYVVAHRTHTHKKNILTRREFEILELLVRGGTINHIGHTLGISPKTVEVHKGHLMHKLGVKNRAQLTTYALKNGLVGL